MFVPIVAGSDKTTVSVATGHQEFHPVYMSPGNLTNVARRTHGNSLLPVAFLPIPKSMSFALSLRSSLCPYLQQNVGTERPSPFRHFLAKCITHALHKCLSCLNLA
jgi:hypothetical protein